MSEKPKPCPFCGGSDIEIMNVSGECHAFCHDCEVSTAEFDGSTDCTRNDPDLAHDFALAAWNTRAPDATHEALREAERERATAMLRRTINAPEDPHVEALCERYGYGAVMDAASRLWARKDSMGAFYIGGCIGMRSDDEARTTLARILGESDG